MNACLNIGNVWMNHTLVHPYIGVSIRLNSDVWLLRYAPMGADVSVFQVADAPMYGCVYMLPYN